ncbi:hypothetical protein K402DRAFT_458669 [Aulographum hederae CBS 113979]|uniref:Uncharacterized protein n=1 Tax=Aulographum hederae CBS 113979 TaxID=1176131 RepID=A0A6G1HGE2_9PEZI|nr:hypothetical protein K402DRAFT_458669 [Aulographum hederae CBS 113979]
MWIVYKEIIEKLLFIMPTVIAGLQDGEEMEQEEGPYGDKSLPGAPLLSPGVNSPSINSAGPAEKSESGLGKTTTNVSPLLSAKMKDEIWKLIQEVLAEERESGKLPPPHGVNPSEIKPPAVKLPVVDLSPDDLPRQVLAFGPLMNFPDSYMKPSADTWPLIDESLVDKALEAHKMSPDPQTVFFVNFKKSLAGKSSEKQQQLDGHIRNWQYWAAAGVETEIQQLISEEELSGAKDGPSVVWRTTYRTEIWDKIMNYHSPMFSMEHTDLKSQHIECKPADVHTELLKTLLSDFTIPTTPTLAALERVITTINTSILHLRNGDKPAQFWIMATTYDYHPEVEILEPMIRLVSFATTRNMVELERWKGREETVSFEVEFAQTRVQFLDEVYMAVFRDVAKGLVEKGIGFVEGATFGFEEGVEEMVEGAKEFLDTASLDVPV